MDGLRHIAAVLLLAISVLSCNSNGGKKTSPAHFPLVQAPAMLDGEQRVSYMAGHFWDAFFKVAEEPSSGDSTIVGGVVRREVEQAMADYITLLEMLPLQESCVIVEKFTDRLAGIGAADSSSSVFKGLSSIFERYVYDPNSPVRDEDLYTPYARRMAQCRFVDPAKREAYADDVRLTSLNRRGTKAADFSFMDRHGRHYSLYGITAERILLFFSNPGCTACKEIIESLESVPGIGERIDSGELAVLNIYVDEDISGWLDYMPIYPENWYNGYDSAHSIRSDELYNVRAIPSLYMLDKDKNVLMKDVPLERILNTL